LADFVHSESGRGVGENLVEVSLDLAGPMFGPLFTYSGHDCMECSMSWKLELLINGLSEAQMNLLLENIMSFVEQQPGDADKGIGGGFVVEVEDGEEVTRSVENG
jgi:hypothetical protein